MQENNQAYERKARSNEAATLQFKRFILEETQTLANTPEADLYRVHLLALMLDRFDDYAANGVQEEAACTYVLREFFDIRARMISEGFGKHEAQKKSESAWLQLSEDEAAAYIGESNDVALKRAIGIALLCACVAPLLLITGVDTLLTGYASDASNLLGLCAMFGTIAAGVYAIVTANKSGKEDRVRKKRFFLSTRLKEKLTEMKGLAQKKAGRKRGRGVALLVASIIPIFIGALMDELWFSWTNDGFTMLGVGGMFVMIGAGVYELVTADSQKKAISELLKE